MTCQIEYACDVTEAEEFLFFYSLIYLSSRGSGANLVVVYYNGASDNV